MPPPFFKNPDRLVNGKWVSNINVGVLCTIIRCIYNIMPDIDGDLRDQVLRHSRLHLKLSFASGRTFKAVLAEIPDFSYRLLVREVESRPSEGAETKKRRREKKRKIRLKSGEDVSVEST